MDFSHLKQKFIEEVNDLLSGLDSDLLELEKNPKSKQHIDQVFRTMHTIKGASGMHGFEKISEITHELESLYNLVRDQKLIVTKSLIDLTFSTADHIRNLLEDEQLADKENIKNQTIIKDAIALFQKNAGITKSEVNKPKMEKAPIGIETWQILFYPDESLTFRGINLSIILGDLYALGKCEMQCNFDDGFVTYWNIFIVTEKGRHAIEEVISFIADNCKLNKIADFDIFNEQEFSKKKKENEERETKYQDRTTIANSILSEIKIDISKSGTNGGKKKVHKGSNRIHVDSSKLDTLMYLVTELVTTKSELLLAIQKQSEIKVQETAEKIEKLSKLFSDNALSIRLVSLQEMLHKYQRLIRDLSDHLGKKVHFNIKGEDTELDKNMVDIVAEPIMHLIRNCMDHGIEIPEKRKERGKDETGIIFFNAFKSGNNVYIQVGDDGTGIDNEYIYRKAVDQGFIQPGSQLTEKEIFELIFVPGFSTAQSLTEVSGRGVGMDIVRKKIQEIRGEIFVESTLGKGTTFTIKLQQTISIIDTLLIVADNSTYALPIEDVELCDLEEHDHIFGRQSKLIEFNNELIPFLYLREKFSSVTEPPEKEKLIVINKLGKRYAIIADKIIGQHQAVIKPLNKTFKEIDFISGASILGDGSIALLLDTDKLKELLVVQYEYAEGV